MAITLQVGNEFFEYPETGSLNYGEDASGWAEAVSEALTTVFGPGDIRTTEISLVGASGNVAGLLFNTSFVQRIVVEGIITRTTNNPDPTPDTIITESVTIDGAFNGSDFNISVKTTGDDTGVTFDVNNSGQFTFQAEVIPDSTVTFKFKGSAIVDESVL